NTFSKSFITFFIRHHVYHHQGVDGATYRVLDTIYPDQAEYHLHNSSLSEYGILGFETGYSYSSPHCLAIWEAQYGDFADTGQAMFDTFICNGESKWICQSGVIMQLPHGIDGAGPEHSSARPERYLMQCDDDEDALPSLDDKDLELKQLRACNWIVCNVTTPANYFHLIRRQIAMPFRKPLVLFTPKVGLKHPYYRSPFKDFLLGTRFQRAIPESGPASKNPEGVKKLIFCSGKVAITIDELRKEKKLEDKIAMCRIEQMYPFPYDICLKEAAKYSKAKVAYCQEEHKNCGPLFFARPRLRNLLGTEIECITRPPSPASATGIKWIFQKELKELKENIIAGVDGAGPPPSSPKKPC
ncbi:2-oxoglutarate dehydrogenase, mitochondrial-like, partial [Hyposmocoma kahamanoa]|uniref:2-oxoglutarate dehydrogenase, mitochondrial-like n=1 Tax=Hyposmocoma kahamanoa TaxID=1477025 RepID=UPI000E6D7A15